MFNKRESENMENHQDIWQSTRSSVATQEHLEKVAHQTFPPLGLVTKPNLTTAELAYYLNRKPQTLRIWACFENGPLRPRRIGGLLAWPTAEAKALAGVPA